MKNELSRSKLKMSFYPQPDGHILLLTHCHVMLLKKN